MRKLLGRHLLAFLIQDHHHMMLISPINAGIPHRDTPFSAKQVPGEQGLIQSARSTTLYQCSFPGQQPGKDGLTERSSRGELAAFPWSPRFGRAMTPTRTLCSRSVSSVGYKGAGPFERLRVKNESSPWQA